MATQNFLIKTFIKGGIWVMGGSVLSKIIILLNNVIIVKLITPTEYGIFSLYFTNLLIWVSFSNLGISVAFQRILAKSDNLNKNTISEKISAGLVAYIFIVSIITLVLFLFETSIGTYLFVENFNNIWYRFAIILFAFTGISNLPFDILIGFKMFKKYAFRFFVFNSISLFLGIYFGYKLGLYGYFIGLTIAMFLNVIYSMHTLINVCKTNGIKFTLNNFIKNINAIYNDVFVYYIGNTLIGAIAASFMYRLVSKHSEIIEMGYLRIAQNISALISFIPGVLVPVSISLFSSSEGNTRELVPLKKFQLKFLTFFLIISMLVLTFFSKKLLLVLFGSSFVDGNTVLLYYLYFIILQIITVIFINFILSSNKGNLVGYIGILGNLISIGVGFFLVPHYNILGYIVGLSVAQILSLATVMIIDAKRMKDDSYSTICAALFGICILTFFYLLLLTTSLGAINKILFMGVVLSGLIYLSFKYIFNKKEVVLATNFLKVYICSRMLKAR